MAPIVAQLEVLGELERVADRFNAQVSEQLVTMSPATTDRMLTPTKDARYPTAQSVTRPGAKLRSSIGAPRRYSTPKSRRFLTPSASTAGNAAKIRN